ncbi:MAG: hypothetical protein KKH01_07275 [Firmicutes bacterium]|nr:hypothetical protein [Bacillota bacterium]
MLFRKGEVNIFITDEAVGIYQSALKKDKAPISTVIDLEKQIVENGYIIDPEALYLKIKMLFKKNNIKPRSVNMTIHDQNLLIREFNIDKEDLQKKTIATYIREQEGRSIHFPFEEANITYYVKAEDAQTISAVVIISDENLLQDYHDVFDRLGLKYVSFNIAPRVLYRLYQNEFDKDLEQAMIVSLYGNMITINILEHGIPAFGMIEECEGHANQYYEVVENYIERVANYYHFNVKKGSTNISDIIVFNFNKQISESDIKNKIRPEIENLKLDVYQSQNRISEIENIDDFCTMSYASSLKKKGDHTHLFNFELERSKRITNYANYILVLSFTIFSAVALIYIPYITFNEDINVQQNINHVLQNQLDTLREETPIVPSTSVMERGYSNAYDYLISQVDEPSIYFSDLLDQISGSMQVELYSLDASTQQIMIVVSATSEAELYEYLIVIYEAYGITDGTDDLRWMASQPSRRFISNLMMEVTINYA